MARPPMPVQELARGGSNPAVSGAGKAALALMGTDERSEFMYVVSQQSGTRSGPPYWLIVREPARPGGRAPEIFTLDLERGKLLPVFGCQQSAEWFLSHCSGGVDPGAVEDGESATGGVAEDAIAESGWRVRAAGAGELVSLLSGSAFAAGPCTAVEKVIVDPSLEVFDRAGRDGEPVGESRACFLESLMGRGRAWLEGAGRAESV